MKAMVFERGRVDIAHHSEAVDEREGRPCPPDLAVNFPLFGFYDTLLSKAIVAKFRFIKIR